MSRLDIQIQQHNINIQNAHNTIAIPVIKSGGSKKMILIVSLMKNAEDKVYLAFILKKAKKYTGTIDKGVLNTSVDTAADATKADLKSGDSVSSDDANEAIKENLKRVDLNSDDSASSDDADYYLRPWSNATNGIFTNDQENNTSLDITTDNGNINLEIDNILVRKYDNKLKYYSSNSNPHGSATHRKKKLVLTFSPSFDMFTNNIRSLSNHFSKIQEYQILQLIKYLYDVLNDLVDNDGNAKKSTALKDMSELGNIYNNYYPKIGDIDTNATLSRPITNPDDIQTEYNKLNYKKIILTYGSKNIYFDFYSTIAHLYFYWLEYAYIHIIINGIVKSSNTKKNILKGAAFTILIAVAVTGVGLLVEAGVGSVISGPFIAKVISKIADDQIGNAESKVTEKVMDGGNKLKIKNYENLKKYNKKLNLIYKRKNLYKKRTNKKRTNKKRTFKKRSNKKRTFKNRTQKKRTFKKIK